MAELLVPHSMPVGGGDDDWKEQNLVNGILNLSVIKKNNGSLERLRDIWEKPDSVAAVRLDIVKNESERLPFDLYYQKPVSVVRHW